MQTAELRVKPLADRLAIAHHNSSDERIGTHLAPPALGQLQRSTKMAPIRACELGVHTTD